MRRIRIHGLIAAFIVLVVFSPPITQAASPPEPCLAYAFTESDSHRFLVASNSTSYGNELNLIHNCGRAEIWIDGSFYAEGESGISVSIEPGNYTVELRGENESWTYSNFEIRPDRLDWDFNFSLVYAPSENLIPESEAKVMQNWAAGATGLIIWVLCVYVYWNLINSYTQRNFIEEVQG
tara:strand:- start:558 stop:1097 length:540 start_codon:yes stop_codon:yes gene_type:complete